MDLLDLTQSFVEHCERPTPLPELTARFQRTLEQMGFSYFASCSHVSARLSHPAASLHNYPSAWVRIYVDRNFSEHDPIRRRAENEFLPFHWDAPEFRATLTPLQEKVLRVGARFGIAHGYTVPIHLPWATGAPPASCSVVPDSGLNDPRAYRAVQVMAMYLHASVGYRIQLNSRREAGDQCGPVLSARERQCLELAAYGKSDWDISQHLHISENTVHKHIEAAKRRLGVSTRMQAVVWAVQRREISLGDVVQAVPMGRTVAARRPRTRPGVCRSDSKTSLDFGERSTNGAS